LHVMSRRRAIKAGLGVWRVWRVDRRLVDESVSVQCWVWGVLGVRSKT
jgi:hypothetical protein